MKAATIPTRGPAYPNAADWRYHMRKAVDILLMILLSAGFVTAVAFLVLL